MTVSKRPLPQGFRTAPPGLLSPAQLLDAVRILTSYANDAKARGEAILEAHCQSTTDDCVGDAPERRL